MNITRTWHREQTLSRAISVAVVSNQLSPALNEDFRSSTFADVFNTVGQLEFFSLYIFSLHFYTSYVFFIEIPRKCDLIHERRGTISFNPFNPVSTWVVFSLLFPIYFVSSRLGEFVLRSKHFILGCSYDLCVWSRITVNSRSDHVTMFTLHLAFAVFSFSIKLSSFALELFCSILIYVLIFSRKPTRISHLPFDANAIPNFSLVRRNLMLVSAAKTH